MKIILKKDVEKLGSLGDEVDVKPGYARNYLIPQGFAVQITSANKKQIEHQRALLAKARQEAIDNSKSLADKLETAEVVFQVKAGESGKLFGSVTAKQVLDALEEQGINLDKKALVISGGLKTLGSHTIPVKLHTEVQANVTIKLQAEKGAADEAPAEAVEGEEAPAAEASASEEAAE